MSYHFMTYDKRDGFDYQRRNTLQKTRLDTRDGEHIQHMEDRRIQIYFSYSYVSFFLVHIVCSIRLRTLNCFSFSIVLRQNTQPCTQSTDPTSQFVSLFLHKIMKNTITLTLSSSFHRTSSISANILRTFYKEMQSEKCSVSK